MSTNSIPSPAERHAAARIIPSAVVCVCLLWCAGCFTKKPTAYRITPVVLAHPVVPASASTAALEAPPNIPLEFPRVPPRLGATHSGPARPRVAAVQPAEPPVAEPEDPLIVPDLSTEQLNAARSETQHSLDASESNLAQTKGKKLSAAQEDVVSKIRGFIDSSREAMKTSDWLRAKNLANKAEVLSRELVANLH
jgi:hypothetical protein